jgi:hypothetical protein
LYGPLALIRHEATLRTPPAKPQRIDHRARGPPASADARGQPREPAHAPGQPPGVPPRTGGTQQLTPELRGRRSAGRRRHGRPLPARRSARHASWRHGRAAPPRGVGTEF